MSVSDVWFQRNKVVSEDPVAIQCRLEPSDLAFIIKCGQMTVHISGYYDGKVGSRPFRSGWFPVASFTHMV